MSNRFQNPKLVIKNGIFLLFRMLIVLFLGFFATRLTLQLLGDEKFGIYNIVGGIIAVFAIVSMPIRDSLQRFFNVEFANQNYSPGVVLRTSVRIVGYMIIVIMILYETIGLYLVNFVIKYPHEYRFVVNVIFQICSLASVLGFAQLPYISLLFSRENMGIPAFCEIFNASMKIVLLYCISYIPIDLLISYSGIFLLLNTVIYFFYRKYCRRKYKECFTDLSINKVLQKSMLTFSGWSFIEAIAGISITYVSNIFINIFGGLLYNTAYGITKQLQNAVVHFSTNVLKAADPQITSGTVTSNIKYRNQLLMTTVKICFLFSAFVYIVFHFDGEVLLRLWLGKIPLYVMDFCEVMLLTLLFTSISLPFRTLIMATGKVKWYFMTYGFESIIIMLLMFVLLKNNYPVIIVMYMILLNGVFMLITNLVFANHVAGLNILYVVKNITPVVVTAFISWSVYFFTDSALDGIFIPSFLSFITMALTAYAIALTHDEKNIMASMFKRIIPQRH